MALSDLEQFLVGRGLLHSVPAWSEDEEEPASSVSPRTTAPSVHASSPTPVQPTPPPTPRPKHTEPPPKRRPISLAAAPHNPRAGAFASSRGGFYPGQPFRMDPRARAQALLDINQFYINNWLARRRRLPAHRTVSKDHRAALQSLYGHISRDGSGVEPTDLRALLNALQLGPGVMSTVMADARPDQQSGKLPLNEFTRLCKEAETLKHPLIPVPPYFQSQRAASEAFPLGLLMENERIHALIDGYVATLERPFGSKPPPPQGAGRRPASARPARPARSPGGATPKSKPGGERKRFGMLRDSPSPLFSTVASS